MHKFYYSIFRLIRHIGSRFIKSNNFTFASNLTFSTLLAMVPLTLVGVSVLSIFPEFSQWTSNIEDFIFTNFLPESAKVIQAYLLSFVAQATELSLVGIISLLISAILMLFNMEQAFNAIWHVEHQRKGFIAFLFYLAIITLSPLLMGLSFALTNYIISFPFIAMAANKLGFVFLLILPFLITVGVFTVLYVAIPNCHVPCHYAVLSALLTSTLFELAKYGFSLYLHFFNTYQVIYGALASFPIFLLWVYLSWLIILLGVEICHSLTINVINAKYITLDPFTVAFLWIGYLWKAKQQEKGLSLVELIRLTPINYELDPQDQIRILCEIKMICHLSDDKYALNIDLNEVSFEYLKAALPWKVPVKIASNANQPWLNALREYINHIQIIHEQYNKLLISFYN